MLRQETVEYSNGGDSVLLRKCVIIEMSFFGALPIHIEEPFEVFFGESKLGSDKGHEGRAVRFWRIQRLPSISEIFHPFRPDCTCAVEIFAIDATKPSTRPAAVPAHPPKQHTTMCFCMRPLK